MLVKRPGFAATSLCIVNVGASQFRGKRVALPAGRATLLNRSIFYSTVSAIITALLIIVAFASAMLRMAHEYGVAILFIVALVFFILSLANLARDPKMCNADGRQSRSATVPASRSL